MQCGADAPATEASEPPPATPPSAPTTPVAQGGEQTVPAAPVTDANAAEVTFAYDMPVFSEVTTAGTFKAELNKAIERVEAQVQNVKPQEKAITFAGVPNTVVRIWRSPDDNGLAKIEHASPTTPGNLDGNFTYYFRKSSLFYARQGKRRYVYYFGNLKYCLDESWERENTPQPELEAREKSINDRVKQLMSRNQ